MAKKKRSIPQQIFLWVFQIVIVVLFAFVLVYFFGQTRACIGQSMSTTIEGGDAVLLDGLSYKLGNPKRNDVNVRLDDEATKRLDEYCAKHDITRAEAIRQGIDLLLAQEK